MLFIQLPKINVQTKTLKINIYAKKKTKKLTVTLNILVFAGRIWVGI